MYKKFNLDRIFIKKNEKEFDDYFIFTTRQGLLYNILFFI